MLREPVALDALRAPLLDRLGPLFSPSRFWSVEQIRRTSRGKVDRRAAAELRAAATPIE